MKTLALVAILAPSLALSAPCPSNSYEVGPYLGLGASWSKLHLKGDNKAQKSAQPYVFGGLKVAPNWSLELGTSLKEHKNKVRNIQHTNTIGPLSITYTEQKPIARSRKVDFRAIGSFPLTGRPEDDVQGLLGLGVAHLKLKLAQNGAPSIKHQRLVPSVLLGVEMGAQTPLKLRFSAAFSPGMKTGVRDIKTKANLSALAGLVWHL